MENSERVRWVRTSVGIVVGVVALAASLLALVWAQPAGAQMAPQTGAWAWGYNGFGQLGDGTTASRTTPVQVSGLADAVDVSAGTYHGLAVKSDETVWAWGNNEYGQLGDGTTADRATPVQVQGLTDAKDVEVGGEEEGGTEGGHAHSLAVKDDGTVWAWGDNRFGQLGDGTFVNRLTPVQVQGLTGVKAVHAGEFYSLALKNDGTVWSWGHNAYGQLGDGTGFDRATPVQVQGLTNVKSIHAGAIHTLALKNDGTVWAWGWNAYGQLGDGTTFDKLTPVEVQGLTGATDIAGGAYHSLAVKSDGTVWAWGDNAYGQLGDGTFVNKFTPVQVQGLTGATDISSGFYHSAALKSDGTVWTWGDNESGQLGDGTTTPNAAAPVQVQGLSGVVKIASGYFHIVALAGQQAQDSTPPLAPTVDLEAASDSGNSEADNVTNDDTPTFVGKAEAGSTVEVYSGQTLLGSIPADATTGAWSYTVGGAGSEPGIAGLGDGTYSSIKAKATDAANNTSPPSEALSPALKVDTVDPTVEVSGFENGDTFYKGDPGTTLPTPGCSIGDPTPTSGPYSQSGSPSLEGGLNAAGVGSATYSCSAEDNAGNLGADEESYSVRYARDGGILQPINPDDSSVFSRGRAVPVKFRLGYDQPNGFGTSPWTLQRTQVSCRDLSEELVSESVPSNTPSEEFRYDSSTDQYIYNANFRDKATGTCWYVSVELNDGSAPSKSAYFKLQK